MSSRDLVRWSGLALLVGGVLTAIGEAVVSFMAPTDPLEVPIAYIVFLGLILTLLSIPALYTVLGRAIGGLGLIGYVLFFASGVMGGAGGATLGIVGPAITGAASSPVSAPPAEIQTFFIIASILGLVGGVLFGATIVRAGVPERYAAMLLILGTLVEFAGNIFSVVPHLGDLGTVLLVLALAWMGWTLMTRHVAEMAPGMAPAEGTTGARAQA